MRSSNVRNSYMAEPISFSVEVVCATPEQQELVTVTVEQGVTARDAVAQSGLQAEFPELDLAACPVGIFGKVVADDFVLSANDRVELYRPLVNDPRESRRALAARGKTMGAGKD